MTREEAIRIIKIVLVVAKNFDIEVQGMELTEEKCKEAVNIATKALEQAPCTDAISREELLRAIDTWDKFGYTETGCFVREPKGDYVPYIHYDDVIKCIKGMPPVTPAEKVGEWIDIQYFKSDDTYYRPKCPFCNTEPKEYSNYCPNCGAWMSASPTGAEGRDE